jgi:RHS repeat-associated protein
VSNHYLYTGQEYDTDVSGAEQYNLRARYYMSGIGRFTSEDPVKGGIRPPQNYNCYSYSSNNPINWFDPTGLWCSSKICKGEPQSSVNYIGTGSWYFYGIQTNIPGAGGIDDIVPGYPLYCIWKRSANLQTVKRTPQWLHWECWHECSDFISSGNIPLMD